ncbi:Rv1355c family protein [Dyadobacter sp. CY326]|uniref:Rv1355c family protein n=1 Tax=Dyadobacter sp. CY326 TaxID=2907300 RepID=UPI001F03022C|nr:Rv1355c family protein [Dyadobacter sp. CY326]MCE7063654.1 Rv1355c family protein [Dyadobacter sp. CY326]
MYPDSSNNTIYKPVFIFKEQSADKQKFNSVIADYQNKIVLDLFASQMKELIKIRSPRKRLTPIEIDEIYAAWAAEKDTDLEGNWIYYPWSNRLLHILNEADFITLRTSRNHYKITPQEQDLLSKRKIGIIGLSVGHAVAVSVATERICGTLKLADFDTIELSNLNRIKTGLHNLGINKCIVTAREIAEIDPYLDIECYPEGITDTNITGFLTEHGKLDILVDECDDLEVKISCREKARHFGIPVVMETSDRGMLDVERFDLDAGMPILHGLLAGIPEEKLRNIAPADRFPLVMRIIDAMNTSSRGRASLLEIGQSISTWPQLASAVTLGGGVVTDVCRRILLNQFTDSGRYYVDLENIIANKSAESASTVYSKPDKGFDLDNAIKIVDSLPGSQSSAVISNEEIEQIVHAGTLAPSAGNDQPWKWVFRNGRLHLFHDPARSHSFANYKNTAAHLALGAALENASLRAKQLGYEPQTTFFPLASATDLTASIELVQNKGSIPDSANELADYIETRVTNRNPGVLYTLHQSELDAMRNAVADVKGAHVTFIQGKNQLAQLGSIIGACELTLLLNDAGHHDFFERNTRWPGRTESEFGDGYAIQSIVTSPQQMAVLSILKDKKIARTLRAIGGGNALSEATQAAVTNASCIAVVAVERSKEAYFKGGMAAQRLWLRVEQLGLAAQPVNAPLQLFERLATGEGLDDREIAVLTNVQLDFERIITQHNNTKAVFLLKINKTEMLAMKSKRLPLNETLFIVNDKI